MDSNSGKNFKDKFRTLMSRTSRLGSDSSPGSPGAKTTLSDFDEYVKSGLTRFVLLIDLEYYKGQRYQVDPRG